MRSVRPRTVCTLSAEEAAAMEFRVLGPVEGVRDGRVIRLDSPTQRALLALFVIHAGRTLSPDRILTEVWPQGAPASGVKTVRYHISKLRDALHDGGETVLHTVQGGYVLDAAAEDIDSIRFERLVDEARTSRSERPDRASRLLRDAPREPAVGRGRGAHRSGSHLRTARRSRRRAREADGDAPAPRAALRTADDRSVSVGTSGRRAQDVSAVTTHAERRARHRSRSRQPTTRGADPGARPEPGRGALRE